MDTFGYNNTLMDGQPPDISDTAMRLLQALTNTSLKRFTVTERELAALSAHEIVTLARTAAKQGWGLEYHEPTGAITVSRVRP